MSVPQWASEFPFSVFGSYLTLTPEEGGITLRQIRSPHRQECMTLTPLWPEGAAPAVEKVPGCMTLAAGDARADWTFDGTEAVRFAVRGTSLHIDVPADNYDLIEPHGDSRFRIVCSRSRASFMLSVLRGRAKMDAPWKENCCEYIHVDIEPEDGVLEGALEVYDHVWTKRTYGTMEELTAGWAAAFDAFAAKGLPVPAEYADVARMAHYSNWLSVVSPRGYIRRNCIYMSKKGMTRIWSWDNCFTAAALASQDRDLALDQLLLPLDYQHESGRVPDCYDTADMIIDFTKPPLYGWALSCVRDMAGVSREWMDVLYPKVEKLVSYWMTCCDSDGDGIPEYSHGNDCGWDNNTTFIIGAPVEGVDLPCYLVQCMDILSWMANEMGNADEAAAWKAKSDALLEKFIAHSWDGEKFRVYHAGSHTWQEDARSLYIYMPLMLGDRLPADIAQKLLSDLKASRNLTEWGLATEEVGSPYYVDDGYWRGPIWAPTMALLTDGIARLDPEFARDLAQRFCRCMAMSGFAENFDAQTGAGLRDRPSFAWTASTFLLLANRYL